MRYLWAAGRGIRRGLSTAISAVPVLVRDAIGLTGAAAIVYGIWLMHVPSAFIAGGAMALGLAFAWARER
jgi:hypothetical protein